MMYATVRKVSSMNSLTYFQHEARKSLQKCYLPVTFTTMNNRRQDIPYFLRSFARKANNEPSKELSFVPQAANITVPSSTPAANSMPVQAASTIPAPLSLHCNNTIPVPSSIPSAHVMPGPSSFSSVNYNTSHVTNTQLIAGTENQHHYALRSRVNEDTYNKYKIMGSPVLKHMSTLSVNKEPKDVDPTSLVPEASEVPANELPEFSGNKTVFNEEQERELKAVMIGNTVNRLRQWCFTDYGITHQKIPQYGLEFTITSYNILAQELLESNSWLYHHVEPDVLQWEYRSRNLIRELRSLRSDIICLQEVQDDHYESIIKPAFEVLDYECLYKKRTGNRRDGCAVFFRRDLFSLVKCKRVEFYKHDIPLCDRDNVGLIVLLRPRGLSPHCDVHLCVATTHLLFNPRRGDIKLAQLRLLLAEMDYVAFKKYHSVEKVTEYHPVILCGDMNSEPFSPLYDFLTKGSLNCSSLLSGDISGQAEGADRGRILDLTQLLTPHILITESSQYSDILKLRQGLKSSLDPSNETPCDEAVTVDQCVQYPMDSSLCVTGTDVPSDDSSSSATSPSSTISHSFNFNSVYSHFCGGNHEVTTHHTRANCTVDYIFYTASNTSPCSSDFGTEYRRPEEGPLHVLANYRLLNDKEMTKLGGLPNSFQSSDHLSLASRFLLKLF